MPPSSSEVDKLKKAKTLRNTEINRIRDTWQIASEAQKDTNIQPEFIQRYRTIDTISDAFAKQHNIICSLLESDEEFAVEDEIRKEFESLSVRPQIIDIFGLGTMKTRSDSGIVQGVIVPLNSESPQLIIEALVLDQVCTSNMPVQYSNIIQEYIDNGHLELADQTIDNNEYFIPHHCVFNPHSVTSPIRIVFDASCKDSNHISLNDCLLKGPKLQKDISAILLNFRLYAIAITADIKAMYRQIQLNPKFYKFQKIFWRFSSEEPVQEYVLKTVTFGVNSSPFLALRTINQLANDEKELFPHASKILLSDNIFVDDICTGCNTVQEATNLQYELSNLLLKGGFELRKWSSNNNDFLKTIPEHLLLKNCINFDLDSALTVKILGLKWNPTEDSFSYSVTSFNVTCTKRNMLSELARIYDPLGFLTPVTLLSKLLIQNLWSLKLNWDDVPPPQIIKRWELYKSQLPDLLKVRIPRYLFSNSFEFIELCGFCDGSQDAYAACIYVRLVSQFNITTSLLCAKSKVAPLKRISIPRVELCAALLLTRLFSFVLKTYSSKIIFKNIYGFTDSTIVLQWLQSSPHRFKPFVANRIAVIQEELPNVHWLHVSSSNNAADPASRGIFPSDFVQCSTWWTGPDFLKKPQSQWPLNLFPLTPDLNQNDE
ncbi:uncharacterized protein LOC115891345, partial [Sitophilus oryzae]|uniref:Uncharacterized protein LOC115891345 n=1 Tax=Sitophilus oryzae TaxID=7048 RepID=A0A6J2YU61_SITOR